MNLTGFIEASTLFLAEKFLNFSADKMHAKIVSPEDSNGKRVIYRQSIAFFGTHAVKAFGYLSNWNPLATSINYTAINIFDKLVIVPITREITRPLLPLIDSPKLKKIVEFITRVALNILAYMSFMSSVLRYTYMLTNPQLIAINLTISAIALAVWAIDVKYDHPIKFSELFPRFA